MATKAKRSANSRDAPQTEAKVARVSRPSKLTEPSDIEKGGSHGCTLGRECPEARHMTSARALMSRSDEYWWKHWVDKVYPFRVMSWYREEHYVTCTENSCPNHALMKQLFWLIEDRAKGPASDHMTLSRWLPPGKRMIGSILASELEPVVRLVSRRQRWQDWTKKEIAAVTKAFTGRTHVVQDRVIPNYQHFRKQLELYILAHPREGVEMDPYLIFIDPSALSVTAGDLDLFLAPSTLHHSHPRFISPVSIDGGLDNAVTAFSQVTQAASYQGENDNADKLLAAVNDVPHRISRLVYSSQEEEQAHAFATHLKRAEPRLVCVVAPYTAAASITFW